MSNKWKKNTNLDNHTQNDKYIGTTSWFRINQLGTLSTLLYATQNSVWLLPDINDIHVSSQTAHFSSQTRRFPKCIVQRNSIKIWKHSKWTRAICRSRQIHFTARRTNCLFLLPWKRKSLLRKKTTIVTLNGSRRIALIHKNRITWSQYMTIV